MRPKLSLSCLHAIKPLESHSPPCSVCWEIFWGNVNWITGKDKLQLGRDITIGQNASSACNSQREDHLSRIIQQERGRKEKSSLLSKHIVSENTKRKNDGRWASDAPESHHFDSRSENYLKTNISEHEVKYIAGRLTSDMRMRMIVSRFPTDTMIGPQTPKRTCKKKKKNQ